MTVTTRIRMLTANFRLAPESAEDIAAGHGWKDGRKDLTIKLLKAWKPSFIAGQECSTIIRQDLAIALGNDWRQSRSGNVVVWFNSKHHTLLGFEKFNLPSPPPAEGATFDPRRLVLVHLRMNATGDDWWAASTHFTSGQPDWQTRQMQAAVRFITDNGNPRNTIFGGDFNAGGTDSPGPRKIARAVGLYDLRGKLAAPRIGNVTSNTFNGWRPPVHDGFWIDDILTGDNFQPYYARVINTNGASDHQWIIASSIQLT